MRTMKKMTAAGFFLELPYKERKVVMLKAARTATRMQREVMKKAETIRARERKER